MPSDKCALWVCPKCDAVVDVKEVLPAIIFDADDLIERVMLTLHILNLTKRMRRMAFGAPFIRFGCWLAGIDFEVGQKDNDEENLSHQ